jgi:hypothetical protein
VDCGHCRQAPRYGPKVHHRTRLESTPQSKPHPRPVSFIGFGPFSIAPRIPSNALRARHDRPTWSGPDTGSTLDPRPSRNTGCSEKRPSVPPATCKAVRCLRLPFTSASAHVRLPDRIGCRLQTLDRCMVGSDGNRENSREFQKRPGERPITTEERPITTKTGHCEKIHVPIIQKVDGSEKLSDHDQKPAKNGPKRTHFK